MEPFMGGSALGAVKAVLVGAALSLLVVAGVQHDGTSRAANPSTGTQVVRDVLDRTRLDSRCTKLGAPTALAARHATVLVQRPSGELAVVPFKEGWAIYTHQQPGTFVSLCLGRAPAAS